MSQNTHMISKSWMAMVLVLGLATASAQEPQAQQPDPRHILEGARLSAVLVNMDEGLKGQLRKGRSKTPVTLFLKGENIQFQFSENNEPWRIFHMRLANQDFKLFEIIKGKTRNFDRNKLTEPIAGTDLTYEDLALRFFYWPDPKLIKMDKVGREECHLIRVNKPDGVAGNYDHVDIWVHAKFGAFMRIRGYNAKGTVIKEFQVEDVMKVDDDTWTLKKMQVSSHNPENGRRTSITEMTFDKPKGAARPRPGLR